MNVPPKEAGHIKIGKKGQELAEAFFLGQGLEIVARNFRCRCGEIDLVLRQEKRLIFAEIKCRRNKRHGGGLQAITPAKMAKIIASAQFFLITHQQSLARDAALPWPPACRFDILAIQLSSKIPPDYVWLKGAFDASQDSTL